MADDLYSRAFGMASSTVLTHLLRALVNKGELTMAEVEHVLLNAEQELAAHKTEVAAGSIGIVKTIRNNIKTG
jgi:hypothetical protein